MGKRIALKDRDGFEFGGYLAEPEGARKAGLVVCQEIFGVNDYIESVCDFYAGAGYVTVAPALFDRVERDVDIKYSMAGRDRGIAIAGKVGWDTALNDLDVAGGVLRSAGAKKVGVIGFCWGGSVAWLYACRRRVDCAVAYYPGEIDHFPNEHAQSPTIIHIGEDDAVIPREKLVAIQAAQADTPLYTYPGAPHGFDNETRPKYNADTARLARERTLQFLAKNLS